MFTNNIWSYLPWSAVIDYLGHDLSVDDLSEAWKSPTTPNILHLHRPPAPTSSPQPPPLRKRRLKSTTAWDQHHTICQGS